MLQGRFDHSRKGRPYIDAIVGFPRFKIRNKISFLVDTGADKSTISPSDALLLRVPYDKLNDQNVESALGVGGVSRVFKERSGLFFLDSNAIFFYEMDIGIIENSEKTKALPSLLGRDILDRWKMSYCRPANVLTFEVLSADGIL